MGRPEPCVLFAQTFVHPHLDEYVDEVVFAEPIVITACEFLEQNASSASGSVSLVGATSPPSFALEVFVQCEGEAKFRRLCHPFLYSHSSSNVLEVDAVVTNHLVVRGSYRSLSLVVYGNTAEDLGQFNVDFDLDSSLLNLVSASVEKFEDLPPVLHSRNRKLEESICSMNALSSVLPAIDIPLEIRQFLQLVFRMMGVKNFGNLGYEVLGIITSTAASFFTNDLASTGISLQQLHLGESDVKVPSLVFSEAKRNLVGVCKKLVEAGDIQSDILDCIFLESEADLATSKELVDLMFQHFQFNKDRKFVGHPQLSESENILLWLSLSLVLCSGKDSCYHYVNGGGMEQLVLLLGMENNSATIALMLLGVIEQATRFSVGCEGLLGWWSHEEETVPSGISEGYSQLLKLLMQKRRHDIAALATYILHRLRFYEVASRYENAVLSILGHISGDGNVTTVTSSMLANVKLQLRKLLKMMNLSGWVDDPSPLAGAVKSLTMVPAEGELSYKATSKLIASSSCRFLHQEIDAKLLSLLKERGFLPLSVALISSVDFRAEIGLALEGFVDVISFIEAAVLSLMFCRSGLIFLLQHSDLSSAMIHAFKGGEDVLDCIPLRYASVLISKGFFCRLREIGINLEMHLRVVDGVDRLLTSTPRSEEFLWVLWELCGLSRSDCGRQALLAFSHFPEAITVLIEALHSAKELEPVTLTSGTPVNLAIFHAAAELCEILVTDLASSSVSAWIDYATDLHKALHSSFPGSNIKDAPTRLLEWIDAGVVYQKNGAVGLLRYAAVLASGGDAHIASTNILVSDSMDVENVVGDPANETELNLIENLLGKFSSEKSFDGVSLRDSSVAQLTTAIRVLAHISENSEIAASLYDEGAMTVIYVILVNCRVMLERSSTNYDYLVDDGTEYGNTSDLLLERNREKCLIDLLIPSLLLLMELLHRLKEAKEEYRNTKLMNVLLRLHREISPKLAACEVDLSSSYPESALGLETVCHLIASSLACWPVHAWAPGLFHTLLDSVQAASMLALGPKETCSMLYLLIDLLPDEGVRHWKNGMPLLTAVRSLAVGTCLGALKEKKVNWYLEHQHVEVLLCQLGPHLDKIAKLVLHYAASTLVVIQDLLRIFILRVARQRAESASALLQPILSWIHIHVIESSSMEERDAYKGYKLLDFLSRVLEHPLAKPLLLKEGAVQMLLNVLGKIDGNGKSVSDGNVSVTSRINISNYHLPVLRSLSLLCDTESTSKLLGVYECQEYLGTEDALVMFGYVFKYCQVLPVGKELLACLSIFKGLVAHAEGQRVLLEAFLFIKSSESSENQPGITENGHNVYDRLIDGEWRRFPLLCCLINLYDAIESESRFTCAIEAAGLLVKAAIRFCMDGKSFNKDRIDALKYFLGLFRGKDGLDNDLGDSLKYVQDLPALLSSNINGDDYGGSANLKTASHQLVKSARAFSLLLLKPVDSLKINDLISDKTFVVSCGPVCSKIHLLKDCSSDRVEHEMNVGEFGDRFQWECPENLRNRLSQESLLSKRKTSAADVANRHAKGETASTDTRGPGLSAAPLPSRRDTFRQRKPNTSRPPSMHVDDYVARERNADGSSNPNVIAVPRLGSSGGRPPSIHVDEFMARQRERQNAVSMAGIESSSQQKKVVPENDNNKKESNKSKQLKVDLDDDLQGLDIVFDAEENEPDDKLAFPQADNNLQQTDSVQQSPQHSIVEETESDVKVVDATGASNVDDNAQSELSTRMSVSHSGMTLRREPSVSSEKKYFEQPDELKNNYLGPSGGFDPNSGAKASRFPASAAYSQGFPSGGHLPADMRMPPPNFIPEINNNQRFGSVPIGGPQGHYEQKYLHNQPPLPPTPPPPTISPVQTDYQSFGNIPTSLSATKFMVDSRYTRSSHSASGDSARPMPPLPPTPPPFSSNPVSMPSRSPTSQSSVYGQNNVGVGEVSQYAQSPMIPPGFGRPVSVPFTGHVNVPVQPSDNHAGMSQTAHASQPHMQSIQQLSHLQSLQPPQMPGPPQLPHQLRPPAQMSLQAEQSGSMSQGHLQMLPPQQVAQQSQISQYQLYYQGQQQDNMLHPHQPQHAPQHQVDSVTQQQMDSAMTLQQYFSSPEAIQSLLSDRDKLCQLLEQHPKLMQMLQERLGHI